MITNKKYHQKPDIVDNISGYVIFGFYACLIIFFAIALTGPQWLYQAGKNERRLEASEIIAYAIELAKSGEHEKAISTLEVAISKAGDLPDIYINYGLSLESLGRYYQAITAYNKAIEFGSRDSSNIYYMISGIYSRYKDKDSIEKYFWKSINVNPYNIDKYLKLGGYYLYKMQWDSSMAALTKAFELQQDMREHYRNMLLSLYYNSDISDTLSYKYIKILSQQNIGYIDSR